VAVSTDASSTRVRSRFWVLAATSDAPVAVPARGTVVLHTYPSAPRITLLATAADDDACKSTSFVLAYTGRAHS
jgi:hypothetical protein